MAKLNSVTITGADDDVDPKELQVSREFPYVVEWAILWAQKRISKINRSSWRILIC
jgi:hypothetical protein